MGLELKFSLVVEICWFWIVSAIQTVLITVPGYLEPADNSVPASTPPPQLNRPVGTVHNHQERGALCCHASLELSERVEIPKQQKAGIQLTSCFPKFCCFLDLGSMLGTSNHMRQRKTLAHK